jgi:tetratricopeptide (TPR) repeat protein
MKISAKHIDIFTYILLLITLIVVGLIYIPVGSYSWILGSDQDLLIDNQLIHNLRVGMLPDLFLTTHGGRYEPLTMLSLSLDIKLWDTDSLRMVHMMNLVYHLLNIVLLFRLIQLVSKSSIVALVTAVLFAFHPVSAEAIAWISARSVLVGAFFLLLALLFYAYYLSSGRRLYFRLSVLIFIFSLLANPIGLIYPLILLIMDLQNKRSLPAALKEKYSVIVIAFLWLIVLILIKLETTFLSQQQEPGWLIEFYYSLFTASQFLITSFIPLDLVAFHPYPDLISLYSIIVVGILVITILLFFIFQRRFKIQARLFWVFLVAVFVNYYLLSDSAAMYHDSQAYVPMISIFFLLGLFLDRLSKALSGNRLTWLLMIFLFVCYTVGLALLSDKRKDVFKDSLPYWSEVIQTYPDDEKAFFMRGDYWAMNGHYEKAKFDYNQCLKRNPSAYMAMNNLGLIYMEEGDLRLALKEFNRAINHNPAFYKPYLNKGISLMRMNKYEEALTAMDHAIGIESGNGLLHYNRGLLHERMNDLQAAVEDFSVAIEIEPDRMIFYKDRGKAYVWSKQFDLAERDYSKAIDLDPGNAELWFRRSLARTSQDKFKGGLEDAMMAKSLGFQVEEEYIKGLARQIVEKDLNE